MVEYALRVVKLAKGVFSLSSNRNVFEIDIAPQVKYDMGIYKAYFKLKINNIYQKNYEARQARLEDFVSFLVFVGLSHPQLLDTFHSVNLTDPDIYAHLLSLPKVSIFMIFRWLT